MNVNLNKTISILFIGTFLGTNVCMAMEPADGDHDKLNAAEEYILSINSPENEYPLSLRNIAWGGMITSSDEMKNIVFFKSDLIENIPEYCCRTRRFVVSIPEKIKNIVELKNKIHFDFPSQLSSKESFVLTCGLVWDFGYHSYQILSVILGNNPFKYVMDKEMRTIASVQLKNAVKKTADFGVNVIDSPQIKYGVIGSVAISSSYFVGVAPWMFGYGLLKNCSKV